MGVGAFSFLSAGFVAGAVAPIFRTFAGAVVDAAFGAGAVEGFPEFAALGGGKLGNPLVFFSSIILARIYKKWNQVFSLFEREVLDFSGVLEAGTPVARHTEHRILLHILPAVDIRIPLVHIVDKHLDHRISAAEVDILLVGSTVEDKMVVSLAQMC